jgi:hypothetical protein
MRYSASLPDEPARREFTICQTGMVAGWRLKLIGCSVAVFASQKVAERFVLSEMDDHRVRGTRRDCRQHPQALKGKRPAYHTIQSRRPGKDHC